MKSFILSIITCLMTTLASAQTQPPIDIDLWPDGLPNSNGIDKSQPFDDATRNFKPSVRVFLPSKDKANGMAVVCCPGGGYSHLAMDHEGYDWAPFFNGLGVAFIVLKYRMPHGVSEVPMSDAREALRLVREHAKEWNINPQRVGIMGSSAGGHLASTVATHSAPDAAPNFQILFYPVISLDKSITHQGTRDGFLGRSPSDDMLRLYSNEHQVTPQTPPAILLLSDDDTAVVPQNSVNYYLALQRSKVKASLHIYRSGGHGWGCRPTFRYHESMMSDLRDWVTTLY